MVVALGGGRRYSPHHGMGLGTRPTHRESVNINEDESRWVFDKSHSPQVGREHVCPPTAAVTY